MGRSLPVCACANILRVFDGKDLQYSPRGYYQLFRLKHRELFLKARSKTLPWLVFDVDLAANQVNALVGATIKRLLSNSKASGNHEDQAAQIIALEDDRWMKLQLMLQDGQQIVLTCLFYIQGKNQQNQIGSFCPVSDSKSSQNYRHLLANHKESLGNSSKAYSKFLSKPTSQPIRSSEESHPKIKIT